MVNFAFILVVLIVLIAHSNAAIISEQQQHITLDLPFKINEDCYQPRETGRCFALFHRFAFNAEKEVCEKFIYGGCGGNKNNFETLEDCESACRISTEANPSTIIEVTSTLPTTTQVVMTEVDSDNAAMSTTKSSDTFKN